MMGVEYRHSGPGLSTAVWDQQATVFLAGRVRDAVASRTFQDGRDVNDQDFEPYSTSPIAIHFTSPTGMRLKPKGGRPIYHEDWMERRMSGGVYMGNPFDLYRWTYDQTRPGRKSARSKVIVARAYDGGYAEYKAASTKGGGDVNLTLSGQLHGSFKVKEVAPTRAVIGLTGEAAVYGTFVNADREFLGLSPTDRKATEIAAADAIRGAMKRSQKR